jgi:hypothetical protein
MDDDNDVDNKSKLKIKGKKVNKGKTLPVTRQQAQRESYRSTVSLPAALGGGGVANATRRLHYPRYSLCRWLGGPPGTDWTGAKNLNRIGIRYPDRPAYSESLYRLSYRGPLKVKH